MEALAQTSIYQVPDCGLQWTALHEYITMEDVCPFVSPRVAYMAMISACLYSSSKDEFISMCRYAGNILRELPSTSQHKPTAARWSSKGNFSLFLEDYVSSEWIKRLGAQDALGKASSAQSSAGSSSASACTEETHVRAFFWRVSRVCTSAARYRLRVGLETEEGCSSSSASASSTSAGYTSDVRLRRFDVTERDMIYEMISSDISARTVGEPVVYLHMESVPLRTEDSKAHTQGACVYLDFGRNVVGLTGRSFYEISGLAPGAIKSTSGAWRLMWEQSLGHLIFPGVAEKTVATFWDREDGSVDMFLQNKTLESSRFVTLDLEKDFFIMNPLVRRKSTVEPTTSDSDGFGIENIISSGPISVIYTTLLETKERGLCLEHTPRPQSRQSMFKDYEKSSAACYVGLWQLSSSVVRPEKTSVKWVSDWMLLQLGSLCTCARAEDGVYKKDLSSAVPERSEYDVVAHVGVERARPAILKWRAAAGCMLFGQFVNFETGGFSFAGPRSADDAIEHSGTETSASASEQARPPRLAHNFSIVEHYIMLSTSSDTGLASKRVLADGIRNAVIHMRVGETYVIMASQNFRATESISLWETFLDNSIRIVASAEALGGRLKVIPTAEMRSMELYFGVALKESWGSCTVENDTYAGIMISEGDDLGLEKDDHRLLQRVETTSMARIRNVRPVTSILLVFYPLPRSEEPSRKRYAYVKRDVFSPLDRAMDWTIHMSTVLVAKKDMRTDCLTAQVPETRVAAIGDLIQFAFVLHPSHTTHHAKPPSICIVQGKEVFMTLECYNSEYTVWSPAYEMDMAGGMLCPPFGIYAKDENAHTFIIGTSLSRRK
jgi:hypothetical protein